MSDDDEIALTDEQARRVQQIAEEVGAHFWEEERADGKKELHVYIPPNPEKFNNLAVASGTVEGSVSVWNIPKELSNLFCSFNYFFLVFWIVYVCFGQVASGRSQSLEIGPVMQRNIIKYRSDFMANVGDFIMIKLAETYRVIPIGLGFQLSHKSKKFALPSLSGNNCAMFPSFPVTPTLPVFAQEMADKGNSKAADDSRNDVAQSLANHSPTMRAFRSVFSEGNEARERN
jgi:hypothetical protein